MFVVFGAHYPGSYRFAKILVGNNRGMVLKSRKVSYEAVPRKGNSYLLGFFGNIVIPHYSYKQPVGPGFAQTG
jgi:hypothetical protein